MRISDLMILQDGLRNTPQVRAMIQFVRNGGFWTLEELQAYSKRLNVRVAPLMEIVQFPDGTRMVHDGHHRAIATVLGGRNCLRQDEYILKNWQYSDYENINFENRWVTPFDPKTEIRKADIFEFKNAALRAAEIDPKKAVEYILQNKNSYALPRKLFTIEQLAKQFPEFYDSEIYVNSCSSETSPV